MANGRKKKKSQRPQSYYDYEDKFKRITVRLSEDTLSIFDKARGEINRVEMFRTLLTDNQKALEIAHTAGYNRRAKEDNETTEKRDIQWRELLKTKKDEAYESGFNEGFVDAEKMYRITYPCCICGKPLVITPNDKEHEVAKEALAGWAHEECPNRD